MKTFLPSNLKIYTGEGGGMVASVNHANLLLSQAIKSIFKMSPHEDNSLFWNSGKNSKHFQISSGCTEA